ncbi:MAG: hypothetical protein JST42_28755 [Bacteroidetes bacterium]|nr:hypothetical protein [Bacteroidota bacterium]
MKANQGEYCIFTTMQWSKLKKNIEGRFADSVKHRVAIFSTQYNNPKSSSGRAWMTIDGKEVANLSGLESWARHGAVYHETTPTVCKTHPAVDEQDRTAGFLVEKGEFSRFDLHSCCWEYLQLGVEKALTHKSPLIQLLAMLDKRLGKRRLLLIDVAVLHPLVRTILDFRLEAEGLKKEGERTKDNKI